ncbi:unnamed protein product [Blepharisma stoltei]|uniref:Uncharacterized protein n=1 Tax=Blepharisma stoltei TaxID=1481888 RepID=A0AAU9JS37_9CILI|nr:unnamed protein product [Blepharisma stoltei]
MIDYDEESKSRQLLKDLYVIKNNPFSGLDLTEHLNPALKSFPKAHSHTKESKKSFNASSFDIPELPALSIGFAEVSPLLTPKKQLSNAVVNKLSNKAKHNDKKTDHLSVKQLTFDNIPLSLTPADYAILEKQAEKFITRIKTKKRSACTQTQTRENSKRESQTIISFLPEVHTVVNEVKTPQKLSSFKDYQAATFTGKIIVNHSHRVTLEMPGHKTPETDAHTHVPKKIRNNSQSFNCQKKSIQENNELIIDATKQNNQHEISNHLSHSSVPPTFRGTRSCASLIGEIPDNRKIPLYRLGVEKNLFAGVRRSKKKIKDLFPFLGHDMQGIL